MTNNREIYSFACRKHVEASSPCMLGQQVLIFGTMLSVSTLGVCNFGRCVDEDSIKTSAVTNTEVDFFKFHFTASSSLFQKWQSKTQLPQVKPHEFMKA